MNQLINDNSILSDDKKISVAVMSSFVILTIQYLILIVFDLMHTTVGSYIQLASKALVGIFYFIALPAVWRRNNIKLIGAYFISFFIFLLNIILFNENWVHLRSILFPFFFTCLPSFIFSFSIKNWSVLKSMMKKASVIVFMVGLLLSILVFLGKASIDSYSMSLSYFMLLPTIAFLDKFIDSLNISSAAITLTSMIIIISLGARGPIMCAGVFFVLKLLNMKNNLTYRNIFIFIIITVTILIVSFYFDILLENLNSFFLRFGIHSRTLSLFMRDNLHLSGRDILYKKMLQAIVDNPILGIGLAGDRRVIGEHSHNLIIEILSGFGIIIGGIILLFLVLISTMGVFSKNSLTSNMLSMWFSLGFVHLMVSSSYLTDFKFWIYLGLNLNLIANKKR